jgi:hypothetical protein
MKPFPLLDASYSPVIIELETSWFRIETAVSNTPESAGFIPDDGSTGGCRNTGGVVQYNITISFE